MIVDYALYAFFESLASEIYQQSNGQFHQTKISEQLLRMNRLQPLDRFELDHQSLINEQVHFEG